MLRDVFYYGNKPNVHPRERHAPNLEAARYLSTTEHFWIINEFCDYTDFDWDFDFDTLPDEEVWTEKHNNVWPSQHQQDSGTWLCSKTYTDIIYYRKDVDFVKRKNIKTEHWEILHPIDESTFDFSWHPDPTEPPYIYRWGCRYFPPTHEPVVQYVVPGATTFKYFDTVVELVPRWDRWKILHDIEMNSFDFRWAPDPTSPPYIYTFGNQHHDAIKMPTLEYHMPNAEERKYVKAQAYTATLKQHKERFEHFEDSYGIDYSWVPDPDSGPYIYAWGNQWNQPEDKISIQYAVQGATTYKYMSERAIRRPCMDNWEVPENVDVSKFDFSWEPSPAEPPFIYQFGTQWQKTGGPRYIVKGATEIKYVDVTKAKAKPVRTNWELPTDTLIDTESFDYSWHPDDTDPPYIYQFGTQWQKTGGPRYVVQGATEIKYVDSVKAKALPNVVNWEVDNGVPLDLNTFDFSWHPDNTETPFIYQFGTQWQKTGGPRYVVQGATEVSYIDIQKARAIPTTDSWEFDNNVNIDKDRFDYSWHPDTTENPFIYQFGTQHQKTGGPRYVMQGATEIKYVEEQKATALEDRSKFEVLTDYVLEFDYSWHPDSSEQPYIYVFGNQHHIAEKMNTVRYVMQGATELKYINDHKSTIIPNKSRFKIYTLIDETKFDFSWIPDPNEPPYVYVWGNKHVPGEIYPTVEFVSKEINKVDGSSGRKFIHNEVELLVEWDRWNIIDQIDRNKFDFTWRPDPTAPPYIYAWGSKHVDPETSPAIEYKVPEATEYKFMSDVVEVLPRFENWFEYEKIDRTKFDYTWRPNPKEPPYIYAWGSKHVLNYVGSVIEYRVPGATDYKYMSNDVETLPNKERWKILQPVDESSFDFTWHPCRNDPPYIYVWGNKWVSGELQSTLEYHVPGATDKKYMPDPAPVLPEMDRWTIIQEIDRNKFDLTWRPDPREPAYIYVWGNKYIPGEKKPTLMYHMPGATEYKYLGDVEVVPEMDRWEIHERIDESKFDLCWRPDPSEPPYIYVWGNKYVPGEMRPTIEYHCEGATERKYMGDAPILPQEERWRIHTPIDTDKFSLDWRPDPREPPFIYAWGNKHVPAELRPTLEYHVPGATEYKYMGDVPTLPEMDKYVIHYPIKDFDFTWMPDPREPPYIYVWGNKYVPAEVSPTVEYHCDGATERKFMSELVELQPQYDNWEIVQQPKNFDFSWVPDPTSPPFIYVWGNKYIPGEKKPTLLYRVKGATEYKYMGDVDVLPEMERWEIHDRVDQTKFDMCWRPDPNDPPYIYVWGNMYVPAELRPTIEYHCEGATERKYMGDAPVLPQEERWRVHQPIDKSQFDMNWRPDPREPPYIYVWGNKHVPGELKPTLEYIVLGATEYKYMDYLVPVTPNWERFQVFHPVKDFDFSWIPDPREPPYIYVWGNKHVPAELRPTIEYHCEGATQRKYMTELLELQPQWDRWEITQKPSNFDFSWIPDPREPPYIYVWGNKWIAGEKKPTLKYHVPGAIEYKYVNNDVEVEPEWDKWNILIPVDKSSFDFSWRPDPSEPPYVYVWGNQSNPAEVEPTIEYHCDDAYDQRKYMSDQVAKTLPIDKNWEIVIPVDDFDFSWRPHPGSPPYIYVFGNKWNDAATEPTIRYHVQGATDYKYMNLPIASTKLEMKYWSITNNSDLETFDFSWRPNPFSPPQIYQWEDNGPRYTVPGATEVVFMKRDATISKTKVEIARYYIRTTLEDLIKEHSDEVFWALNPDINYDNFNFGWKPNEKNFRHINVFGNEYAKDTQTYYINGPMYNLGHREYNYVEDQKVEVANTKLSMFYIDRGNVDSNKRYDELKKRFPNIVKTRYLNSWVDTINRCLRKSETTLFWVVNSEYDYTNFKFNFYPSPWQMKMVHVFGTQWSHWGHTYLINKETFIEDTKYVKIIEHLNCLNFVKGQRANATDCLYDIYLIDHGNFETSYIESELRNKYDKNNITIIPHNQNYLETFKDILDRVEDKRENYIWICNSVCGYDDFDFSYICDPFSREQLHVFPSDRQKYGDTFLVNVDKLREQYENMRSLDDYDQINFNQHQRTNRLEAPEIVVEDDTHTEIIHKIDFEFPYVILKTRDNNDIRVKDEEPISLWSNRSKTVTVTTTGATRIIVPKEVKKYIKDEYYDYPFIAENIKKASKPLDIVFLSNGESNAEENYQHLLEVTKGLPNRVVRVDGVNGRVAAYHAAASASNTNWLFTVFAKLKVDKDFDWGWQPDRLRKPKHYIFHALNPVNGLSYGHQAMIAYNKKLTLANSGRGLDFTLDDLHDTVPTLSGVAEFNTDSYSTWRTAFREVIKLKSDYEPISAERLKVWLSVAEGNFAEDCLRGARDAINFYNEVNGDIDQLKLSYEWSWLKEFYTKKYK